MLDEIARHARTAASAPYSATSPSSSSHHPLAKPPLRPLGPPPQMSCSRTTIPRLGSDSVRKYAVHKPVKPPPTITTSALTSLSSCGQAMAGSAASASRSHQLRCAPGVSASPLRFRAPLVGVGIGTVWLCETEKVVAPSHVASLLERGVDDHPALVVPDRLSLSYARLRDLTDDAARSLVSHGIGQGDRVAMVFPNGPEAILLFLAVSMVATACPLNAAYKEDEFRFYLEDVGARFLLVPPGETGAARRAMPAGGKVIEAGLDGDGRLHLNRAGSGKRLDSLDLSAAGDVG